MPLYDYDCAACGRRIEVVHGVYAPGPTHCPNCGGGPLKKAIAAPAVHFKGSGWAKRDRRSTATPGSARTSSDAPAATDGEGKDGAAAGGPQKSESGSDRGKDSGSDRAADRDSERPTPASKSTGAGTATKTD